MSQFVTGDRIMCVVDKLGFAGIRRGDKVIAGKFQVEDRYVEIGHYYHPVEYFKPLILCRRLPHDTI